MTVDRALVEILSRFGSLDPAIRGEFVGERDECFFCGSDFYDFDGRRWNDESAHADDCLWLAFQRLLAQRGGQP